MPLILIKVRRLNLIEQTTSSSRQENKTTEEMYATDTERVLFIQITPSKSIWSWNKWGCNSALCFFSLSFYSYYPLTAIIRLPWCVTFFLSLSFMVILQGVAKIESDWSIFWEVFCSILLGWHEPLLLYGSRFDYYY